MNTKVVSGLLALLIVFSSVSIAKKRDSNRLYPVPSELTNPNQVAPEVVDFPRIPMSSVVIPPRASATDEVDSVAYTIGTTYYDYFSNGNQNRLIERDHLGGLHAAWMNGRANNGGDRIVSYASRASGGVWQAPAAVYAGTGAGYCNVDVLSDGRAAVAAHRPGTTYGYTSTVGIDDGYQLGAFVDTPIDDCVNPTSDSVIWPSSVITQQNRAVVYATERANASLIKRLFYTRSDSAVTTFPNFSYPGMRTMSNGVYTASTRSGSNRVAAAWANTAIPTGFDDLRGYNNARGFAQMNNNVSCVISNDGGTTWNWDNPINVTRFATWDSATFARTGDTLLAAGDTFRFYNDCAMLFDNQNLLHIVFITRGYYEDGSTDTVATHGYPVKRVLASACEMWHWSEARPNQFDWVANGWWTMGSSASTNSLPWQLSLSRPSMSIDASGNLYCVWTQYDAGDVAGNGYAVGDVYASKSTDNGQTWYHPTNLTNTPGDSLGTGLPHSETFPSVQEFVGNDTLYVCYVDRRDGGEAVNPPTGATMTYTLNQMIVQAVPVNSIRTDSLLLIRNEDGSTSRREMWVSHIAHQLDVKEIPSASVVPSDFQIIGNYPNPFNPTTEIMFQVAKSSDIRLAVYDVNGREVAQLASGTHHAGKYTVTFDGSKLASGVYFAKLSSGSQVTSRKLTLLK